MEDKKYPFADKFKRKNLEASLKKGTKNQQNDMAGCIAMHSQFLGELGDMLGGRKDPKKHQHHLPKNLTQAVIKSTKDILDIRKEIEENSK